LRYSVIIPVYNAANTLARCLDSLTPQLHENGEILLINDGSTDGSDIICKQYSAQYTNIRYFVQDNKGVSYARNACLEAATGEYILFVDSDDYVNENYFSIIDIHLSKFKPITEDEHYAARAEYGFSPEQFVMLYAADLSYRKNQPMLFRALARLKETHPDMLLLLPGQPILKEQYMEQCEALGISNMVRFLGYRRDIDRLLAACDCVVSSSRQEGLPLNLIEAAARGRYIIATDVRGNADVVKQCGHGALVKLDDDAGMAREMVKFCNDRKNLGHINMGNFCSPEINKRLQVFYVKK